MAKEYIEREELQKALEFVCDDTTCPLHIAAEIEQIAALAPTADVVAVVRCEKCEFWDRDHISCEALAKCLTGEGGIRYRNRRDYCSRGVRKENDNV